MSKGKKSNLKISYEELRQIFTYAYKKAILKDKTNNKKIQKQKENKQGAFITIKGDIYKKGIKV